MSEGEATAFLEAIEHRGEVGKVGPTRRVVSGDNYLELDLRHRLDRALFRDRIKPGQVLNVERHQPEQDVLTSSGNDDDEQQRVQFIIPYRDACARDRRELHDAHAYSKVCLKATTPAYHPGSQWLYVKIFCSPDNADMLIGRFFPKFANAGREFGCRKAFFIRYSEGGNHLRLRAEGEPDILWGPFQRYVNEELDRFAQVGKIDRFEYSSYFPEASRYRRLDIVEHIFALESSATATFFSKASGRPDLEERRWMWAMHLAARIFSSLPLPGDAVVESLSRIRDGYAAEFSADERFRKGLNLNYRRDRAIIENLLGTGDPIFVALSEDLRLDQGLAEHLSDLRDALGDTGLLEVLPSLFHMAMNRVFSEAARFNEFVLAHHLLKAWISRDARRKGLTSLDVGVDA